MSEPSNPMKYDEFLTQILVNEKSILGFLSTIFNFLARRTDFYYIAEGPQDTIGFPPGVAEELVIKVLRSCDPKSWKSPNGANIPTDINNEIMCSTVAHEIEVVADEVEVVADEVEQQDGGIQKPELECKKVKIEKSVLQPQSSEQPTSLGDEMPMPITATQKNSETYSPTPVTVTQKSNETYPPSVTATQKNSERYPLPPVIPTQKNSETYNGAKKDKYSWAQTIMDLDITVKLPPHIKSSRELKVTINPRELCVTCLNGDVLLKDSLPHKIKTLDSFWSVSDGKLFIHLEKFKERWWDKLLISEEAIDLSKIDCSRPLDDLPDDHIAKIRELQWNQEQKMKGLPTSDQIKNLDILKKAWNADGSPFKGTEFDPSILHTQ